MKHNLFYMEKKKNDINKYSTPYLVAQKMMTCSLCGIILSKRNNNAASFSSYINYNNILYYIILFSL